MNHIVATLAVGAAAALLAPAALAQMEAGSAGTATAAETGLSPRTPVTVINREPDTNEIVVVDDAGQQTTLTLNDTTRIEKPAQSGASGSRIGIEAIRVGDRILVTASSGGVAQRIEVIDVTGIGAGPPGSTAPGADPATPQTPPTGM